MSRFGAFASVAALFLSGVAIGALGLQVARESRRPFGPPDAHLPPRGALDELEQELGLTREQRRTIEALADENRRTVEEIRREIKPRIDRRLDETERKLLDVLTPGQRERFEVLRKERRIRPIGLFLGPPPPPPPPMGPPGPPRRFDGGPPPPP
jgi:Spy/CpxP family protein refolding chaperone